VSEKQTAAPWRCEVAFYPGGVMWLTLTGAFDVDIASTLKAALERAREWVALIVVDVRGLESIDAAGRRALTTLTERLTIDGVRTAVVPR
jgi:anti-anti-sigma regulatory factor